MQIRMVLYAIFVEENVPVIVDRYERVKFLRKKSELYLKEFLSFQ
jgi:hypothetical protein